MLPRCLPSLISSQSFPRCDSPSWVFRTPSRLMLRFISTGQVKCFVTGRFSPVKVSCYYHNWIYLLWLKSQVGSLLWVWSCGELKQYFTAALIIFPSKLLNSLLKSLPRVTKKWPVSGFPSGNCLLWFTPILFISNTFILSLFPIPTCVCQAVKSRDSERPLVNQSVDYTVSASRNRRIALIGPTLSYVAITNSVHTYTPFGRHYVFPTTRREKLDINLGGKKARRRK